MPITCFACGQVNSDFAMACTACGHTISIALAVRGEFATPFVGRQRELEILRARLDGVLAGQGGLLMLVGEAGIGKTRVAREFARTPSERGALVLSGCCFEGDWHPPYGPWVEALGEYARTVDPTHLRRELGLSAQPLGRLVPEVRAALPDTPSPPPLLPDEERFRLYDGVSQFLLTMAKDKPVLLMLDDLHWADRDSLRLLRHVARFVTRTRILVLGIYRDEELDLNPEHPLADLLAVLRRETEYEHVAVQGLSYEEVAEYLARAAGHPLPQALVRVIYNETNGNPFYVREVFRHLMEEGKIVHRAGRWWTDLSIGELGIPEGIRRVVDRRLSRLSENAANLLRLAAAFTGGFAFPVLKVLTGLPEEELLNCTDEALEAGFIRVTQSTPPIYGFTHAIVRNALYEGLNPDRRARFHRRIAGALEMVYAGREEELAAELAEQYHASASLPGKEKGIRHALAAAEQAKGGYAYERVVNFLRMARHLAADCAAGERADVLCKLAIAEAEAIMLEAAQGLVEEALAALSEAGAEGEERAEFLARAARVLKDSGADHPVWERLVDQGLALVGDRRNLLWARLELLRDRFEPISSGPISTVRWLGHNPQAVAIARTMGDEEDYARTLDPLDWHPREETEAVRALALKWERPRAIMRAMDVVGRDMLKRHGAHREAVSLYQELLEASERYGSIPGQAEALLQLAIIQTALGEFAQARRTAEQAQEMIARLGAGHGLRFGEVALQCISAYFTEGDWSTLAMTMAVAAASPQAARNPRAIVAGGYAALGFARAGNEVESRRILDALIPILMRMEPRQYVYHAVVAFGGSAVWELGEAALAVPFQRLALDLIAAGFGEGVLAHEITVGRMSALMGDLGQARSYFAQARRKLEASGLRPARAIVDYDEALALVRSCSEDQEGIHALLNTATAAFRNLGMEGWAKRALALKEGTPASALPAPRPAVAYPAGLTAREVEVLLSVASGKTNKEIAGELTVSVATVERHIANIYSKIRVHRRAEATAYALSHGLAPAQLS